MIPTNIPQIYQTKALGFEPKENTLVDEFKTKINETINRLLAGHYQTPERIDVILHHSADKYARAGLVQYALEEGYSIKCRIIRRAIEDIVAAMKDENFKKTWTGGDYVLGRVARETQMRMEKLIAGHSPKCEKECTVKL